MNAADYLKLADTLAGMVAHAMKARAEARRIAEASGVSVEDLDAADARFAQVFTDPLKDE